MYQINLSLAVGLYQYKNQQFPIQQQEGRLNFFNEYLRRHYPINQHDSAVLSDNNNIGDETMSRLNWLKRDLRLNSQSNKRMLCFFHAVNCFG